MGFPEPYLGVPGFQELPGLGDRAFRAFRAFILWKFLGEGGCKGCHIPPKTQPPSSRRPDLQNLVSKPWLRDSDLDDLDTVGHVSSARSRARKAACLQIKLG